ELRGDQEPTLAFDPPTQLDREDRTVERAHVVEREDRGSAQGHVLRADDADAEEDPNERSGDREADTPPAVELAPAHDRHASVRPMDALAIRDRVGTRRDGYLAELEAMVNIDCGS